MKGLCIVILVIFGACVQFGEGFMCKCFGSPDFVKEHCKAGDGKLQDCSTENGTADSKRCMVEKKDVVNTGKCAGLLQKDDPVGCSTFAGIDTCICDSKEQCNDDVACVCTTTKPTNPLIPPSAASFIQVKPFALLTTLLFALRSLLH